MHSELESGTFTKLADLAKNPHNKTFSALPVQSRKISEQSEKQSGHFPERDQEDSAREQLVKRQNSNTTKKSAIEQTGGKLLKQGSKDLTPQNQNSSEEKADVVYGLMSQRKGKTGIQMMTMNAQDMEIEALQKGNRYGVASSDEDEENQAKGKQSSLQQLLRL